MKLVTYSVNGARSVGKVVGDRVIDLAMAYNGAPQSMLELLRGGPALLERLAAVTAADGKSFALSDVKLEAPISNPQKFLAIGLNYQDHIDEIVARGGKAPDQQLWFNKQVSCITGPYDPIYKPKVSDRVDYEGELGVVIGTRCRYVSETEALGMVAGYCVINDVTARDWQRMTPQWTLGKSFDSHGPIGPWIVTADEVPDPQNLQLRVYVNGALRQQTSTALMAFNVAAQISHLSQVMTLEPGDVLATGTTSGAGWGMDPPQFLQPGDVVRVEIDGIGRIENTVAQEPEFGYRQREEK